MGLIILDRDNEDGSNMRSDMRRHMRGSYKNYGGSSAMMKSQEYEEAYKKGYEEGYEDGCKDAKEEMQGGGEYRRSRNSHGQYM